MSDRLRECVAARCVDIFSRVHQAYNESHGPEARPRSGITHDGMPFEWSMTLRDRDPEAIRFIHEPPKSWTFADFLAAAAVTGGSAAREYLQELDRLPVRRSFSGNFTRWFGAGADGTSIQLKAYINPWAHVSSFQELYDHQATMGLSIRRNHLEAIGLLVGSFDRAYPSMIGYNFKDVVQDQKLYFCAPAISFATLRAFLDRTGHDRITTCLAGLIEEDWVGELHVYVPIDDDPLGSMKVNLNVTGAALRRRAGQHLLDHAEHVASMFRRSSDASLLPVELTYIAASEMKTDVYFKPRSDARQDRRGRRQ